MADNHTHLLDLLKAGISGGAFTRCDAAAIADIQKCIDGLMVRMQVAKALGYEADTYLISFHEPASMYGLVLKVVSTNNTALINAIEQECAVLRQMVSRAEFVLPRFLGSFEARGVHVFVTEMLAGHTVTDTMLSRERAVGIARSIYAFQHALSTTNVARQKFAAAQPLGVVEYYAPKLRKFLEVHCGLIVTLSELAFLNPLERLRATSAVVVSDRSPANMILDDTQIGMFDFGLLLVGVPFEDWAWFIDDPRLASSLTREELIEVFCECFEVRDASSMFNLAAFFVCLKQYCIMSSVGRKDMANHYLRRAGKSAEDIPSVDARLLIERLKPAS